jgi:thiol:disulfide interchange protein DsbD
MKGNMFPKPEIAAALNEFVLVELYSDGEDATVAKANQDLEWNKFQSINNPFYVLMDADQNVIKTFDGYTPDVQKYLAFLKSRAPQKAQPVGNSQAAAPPVI